MELASFSAALGYFSDSNSTFSDKVWSEHLWRLPLPITERHWGQCFSTEGTDDCWRSWRSFGLLEPGLPLLLGFRWRGCFKVFEFLAPDRAILQMVQLQERGDDLVNLGTKMDEKLNSWSWGASANSDFSRLMRDTRQVAEDIDNWFLKMDCQ